MARSESTHTTQTEREGERDAQKERQWTVRKRAGAGGREPLKGRGEWCGRRLLKGGEGGGVAGSFV